MTTPNLGLPFILQGQAQKEVTHNEALIRLDALVHGSVRSRTLTTPPGSPANGERWIVPSGATGAWAGQTGRIAHWNVNAWVFYVPMSAGATMSRTSGSRSSGPMAIGGSHRWHAEWRRAAPHRDRAGTLLTGAFVETTGPAIIADRMIVLAVASRTTLAITGATSYGVGVAGNTSQFGGSLGIRARLEQYRRDRTHRLLRQHADPGDGAGGNFTAAVSASSSTRSPSPRRPRDLKPNIQENSMKKDLLWPSAPGGGADVPGGSRACARRGPAGPGWPRRAHGQHPRRSDKFRDAFEAFDTTARWNAVQIAPGDIVQVDGNVAGASYLVISKDPLSEASETIIETLDSFTMPVRVAAASRCRSGSTARSSRWSSSRPMIGQAWCRSFRPVGRHRLDLPGDHDAQHHRPPRRMASGSANGSRSSASPTAASTIPASPSRRRRRPRASAPRPGRKRHPLRGGRAVHSGSIIRHPLGYARNGSSLVFEGHDRDERKLLCPLGGRRRAALRHDRRQPRGHLLGVDRRHPAGRGGGRLWLRACRLFEILPSSKRSPSAALPSTAPARSRPCSSARRSSPIRPATTSFAFAPRTPFPVAPRRQNRLSGQSRFGDGDHHLRRPAART